MMDIQWGVSRPSGQVKCRMFAMPDGSIKCRLVKRSAVPEGAGIDNTSGVAERRGNPQEGGEAQAD